MIAKLLRLTPFVRRQWLKLVAIIAMTVGVSAVSVLQPWPLKILVDNALGGVGVPQWVEACLGSLSLEPTPVVLVMCAGLLAFVIFLISSAFDVGLSWGWMATGQRMVYDLATVLFHRLTKLSLLFHSRGSVGDYLDRLTHDTWCVYTCVNLLLVSPIRRIVTLVGIGIVAWMLNPWLTLLSFAMAPILAGSVFYFGPRLKRRAKLGREAQSQLTRFVHLTVTAIPLVQAFSAEQRNQEQYDALVEDVVATSQKGVLVNKSYALVNGLANSAGRAIVIFAGSMQILSGNLTVGSLLVFLAYVRRLQDTTSGLLEIYGKLKSAEASLDRLYEVLDAEDMIHESDDACPLPTNDFARGASVCFDKVTFGYEPDRPVLKNVSFETYHGEKIAIVGPTGAGKSTLVSLIPRFFDPDKGRVLVNEMDVRWATLDSLRSQIAMVLQEPFLLPLTVAENIAYGCSDASRSQIIAAAKAANADEIIQQLPLGYDTDIGQRGSTLSGGQKQRIAIARALVRDAPIVILDEPTSALDAETEAKLLDALDRLAEGRTTFIIAHRLSTIRGADRILVVDDGRIVESGTLEQLLPQGRLYAEFHTSQFGAAAQEVAG